MTSETKKIGELTESEFESLIDRSMAKTLVKYGLDLSEPFELQADARFVRKVRKTHERVGTKALMSLIGLMVTVGGSVLVVGLVAIFTKKAGSV